jgi:hypothetical protein
MLFHLTFAKSNKNLKMFLYFASFKDKDKVKKYYLDLLLQL